MHKSFFVYILANKKNVCVTNNLARRVTEHKARVVPEFTRKYGVDRLLYFEAFAGVAAGRSR